MTRDRYYRNARHARFNYWRETPLGALYCRCVMEWAPATVHFERNEKGRDLAQRVYVGGVVDGTEPVHLFVRAPPRENPLPQ